MCLLILLFQLSNREERAGGRRKSNSGFRKLSEDDRTLLFAIRTRRRTPWQGLRFEFGVSAQSASNYYTECLEVFHSDIVPRLVHPLSAPQIKAMTPLEFARDLPGCLVIFDLTGFAKKGKENVLLSRLLWSAYHHKSECGVLFGMYIVAFGLVFRVSFPLSRLYTEWIIHFSLETSWRHF